RNKCHPAARPRDPVLPARAIPIPVPPCFGPGCLDPAVKPRDDVFHSPAVLDPAVKPRDDEATAPSANSLSRAQTMSIKKYNEKRDFHRTPEPSGKTQRDAKSRALRFVVQKHRASRLHYDF